MRRIGISIKPGDMRAKRLALAICRYLHANGCKIMSAQPIEEADDVMELDQLPSKIDLMIVLGGDGTLLHVARRFIGSHTPLFGVNLGRLGFLTDTPAHGVEDALRRILAGEGKVEERFSLCATTVRDGKRLASGHAVNDVVLQRSEHPRMIGFEMRVDHQFVFALRADGLVLATPAGSTAYALSAGGPIVHPSVDAISVVPICPHTLSNRPIVLPAKGKIELRLSESQAPAALNLDGQEHQCVRVGDTIRVQKGPPVRLVYLPDRNYYEVLRSKLHWGARGAEKDAG